jgi:hypothetical protein
MDELEPQAGNTDSGEQLIDKANRAGKALGLPGQLTVRRSSGELDPGWLVLSPSQGEDGQEQVVVIKEIDGQINQKTIPLEEARQLNPQSPEGEVITGVPDELGGQAVRQSVEADKLDRETYQKEHPVQGVHTDIVSGRIQGRSYLTDASIGSEAGPKAE